MSTLRRRTIKKILFVASLFVFCFLFFRFFGSFDK